MVFWLLVYFLLLYNMQKTAFQNFVKNRPRFNRKHVAGKLLVYYNITLTLSVERLTIPAAVNVAPNLAKSLLVIPHILLLF